MNRRCFRCKQNEATQIVKSPSGGLAVWLCETCFQKWKADTLKKSTPPDSSDPVN